MKSEVIAVLAIMALAACALPQRGMSITNDVPGMAIASYPAELRGTYILTGSPLRFCAEPAPDVSLTSSIDMAALAKLLSVSGQQLDAQLQVRIATALVELSGRTQVVLLARELLYRACEFAIDHPNDATDALALYRQAADVVQALGRAEEDRAAAALALTR